ncbi:amino acid ABC transporter substrate-binding protein [Ectobacillus antri]|jgi:cystine transport system substrate-binding protein|uniref:Amino acid ABC transporter substrate-binding protein n=1 Tax=Ectobacillus antri TaxID=2486280 RepID=A0ABT6H5Z6_9BACI|nr:amino acid ABC transporter substrate-binding protein [Ectobacillus antri]MDG4656771.1 amino acid ABC transporter substrate-binding protein [Ectobacillus antri]MDG5753866.1 amino acid ABC transporter substrate-binding protein [Ectobacillus antri]
MKKLLSILLVAMLAFAAGCAKEEKKETAAVDTLAKIQKDGEFLIGTEGTYPPFTFHDEKGKLTGFDVEIAEEIAKRMKVKAVFKETQWDAMFAGLDAKRFDMVANQVGIREDRQKKYDFSKPYISSSAVLVIPADKDKPATFEEIKGLKAAQSLTSNYGEMAKKNGAEIVGVEGFNQAVELLSSGRVDLTINDRLSVLNYLQTKKDAKIKIADTEDNAAESGLLFRKGSDTLVKEVNKHLDDMMKDGTYEKISTKWFGEDVRSK